MINGNYWMEYLNPSFFISLQQTTHVNVLKRCRNTQYKTEKYPTAVLHWTNRSLIHHWWCEKHITRCNDNFFLWKCHLFFRQKGNFPTYDNDLWSLFYSGYYSTGVNILLYTDTHHICTRYKTLGPVYFNEKPNVNPCKNHFATFLFR